MRRLLFQKWCAEVTAGIHTHPDREQTCTELTHHLDDKYHELLAAGLEPQTAAEQAIAAMGDPRELYHQLNAAHPPLSGLIYNLTKRVLIVLLCVTALTYLLFFTLTHYVFHTYVDFDPSIVQLGENERQLAVYKSGSFDSSDGYLFWVSDASLWSAQTINSRQEISTTHHLNVRIESLTWVPWAETPDFSEWMWAVDSLGNYYYAEREDSMASEPSVIAKDYHTGMFTYTHNLWLRPCVSMDAEWIEIHYDRSGRDVVLRIELSGGETP